MLHSMEVEFPVGGVVVWWGGVVWTQKVWTLRMGLTLNSAELGKTQSELVHKSACRSINTLVNN